MPPLHLLAKCQIVFRALPEFLFFVSAASHFLLLSCFQFFRTMPCNLFWLGTACSWTRLGLQSLLLEVDGARRLLVCVEPQHAQSNLNRCPRSRLSWWEGVWRATHRHHCYLESQLSELVVGSSTGI